MCHCRRVSYPTLKKTAIVRPLLKKPSLDKNILKNYRRERNLCRLSKVVDKVVATLLPEHLISQNMADTLQSDIRLKLSLWRSPEMCAWPCTNMRELCLCYST